MDTTLLLAYAVALLLLYLVARVVAAPVRLLLRLVRAVAVGAVAIWLLDVAGGLVGVRVPLNPWTALVAGYLGIPGLIALVLLGRLWAGAA